MGFEIVAEVVRVCLSRDISAAAAWFCIFFANTNIHVPTLTIRKCKYSHTPTKTNRLYRTQIEKVDVCLATCKFPFIYVLI